LSINVSGLALNVVLVLVQKSKAMEKRSKQEVSPAKENPEVSPAKENPEVSPAKENQDNESNFDGMGVILGQVVENQDQVREPIALFASFSIESTNLVFLDNFLERMTLCIFFRGGS
jgi:hypothetical protein